jgi:valyl-tRNA synthetase
VSEEVWQHLKKAAGPLASAWGDALIIADWPKANEQLIDASAEASIGAFIEAVRIIRNARAEQKVEPTRKITALIAAGEQQATVSALRNTLARLAGLDMQTLKIETALMTKPTNALTLVASGMEIYLPLAGMIDADKERDRLSKELAQAESDVAKAEKLLDSDFAKRAPAAVVEKERAKLAEAQDRRAKLQERITALS